MEIDTIRRVMKERDAISVLETVDVHTGHRSVLKEFDEVMEAPSAAVNTTSIPSPSTAVLKRS